MVPCAVMLHVLIRRPLVTMTENSYSVLGFRPVTMWFRLVVLAIWGETSTHTIIFTIRSSDDSFLDLAAFLVDKMKAIAQGHIFLFLHFSFTIGLEAKRTGPNK